MAQTKKIDLRTRLNKGGAGGAGSAPPGGIPAPIISNGAGASLPGGIPVPAVAPIAPPQPAAPPRPSGPTVNPDDPYATVKASAATPPPAATTIQVDEGAIEQAKKQVIKFIPIAGVGGLVVGLGIGSVLGSGSKAREFETRTIVGAADMAKDVEASNVKIKQLADKIQEAAKSLKEKKFPETFATDLGSLNVPFDGSKLFGRSIGSYDGPTQTMLFRYLSDVESLNDRKDALRNIFAGRKAQIEQSLKANENPVIGYTLIVTKTPKGQAVGSLAPLIEPLPFAVDKEYPKEFKFKNTADGSTMSANKYESGDAFSTQQKAVGILIEPRSLSAAFPSDAVGQILGQVLKIGELIQGTNEGEDSKPGLAKDGEALVEKLKKIAAKGGG